MLMLLPIIPREYISIAYEIVEDYGDSDDIKYISDSDDDDDGNYDDDYL